MNTPDDRIWDELGVAWRAAQIDTTALTRQLRRHLRRESRQRRLGTVIGAVAAIILALALIRTHRTAWQRSGVICLAELAILGVIGIWILRSPWPGDTASLIGMLELAASHAGRRRRETWIMRYVGPAVLPIAIAAVVVAARTHGRDLEHLHVLHRSSSVPRES